MIYTYYKRNTNVTLPVVKESFKKQGVLEAGAATLSKLLRNLDVRYTKDCN